jgi:hypothetical protein
MQSNNANTGYIEVRFMTGNSNVCNVARAIKQFLAAAREQDYEFTMLPLAGIGNNICIIADVPNSKIELNSISDMMLSLTTSMANLGFAHGMILGS